jgi:integral membrane sensor domain MASE1
MEESMMRESLDAQSQFPGGESRRGIGISWRRRRRSVVKQAVKSFSLKYLALIVFLALVHFFFGHLNLKLSLVYPLVTPIWITAGIELAAMVVYGYRVWPAIFVGSLLSHLTTLGSSFSLSAGATLEALAGAYLVNKFAHGTKAFDTAAGVFRFVFLGCIFSPLISPTLGVGRLYLIGQLHLRDAVLVWLTWWLAHGIGVLMVAPFLILLLRSSPKGWDAVKLGELAVLLLGLIFFCLLVFGPLSASLNNQKIIAAWLCIPFLIWAAFRFRPLEATGTTLILFGSAIWGTVQGYGSFLATSLTTSLLLLDTFIGVIGTMTLVIAAMVAERKLAEEKLLTTQRLLQEAAEEKEQDLIVTVHALEVEATGHARTKTALRAVHERLRRITPNTKLGGKS